MIHTYTVNGETWIDVDQGTPEEIHTLMDTYNIHPFVAKEMASQTPKPVISFHDHYIYCILHFPAWKHSHTAENKNQEVDFVIGKDVLITTRYDTIDALHKFSKELEVNEILDKGDERATHTHIIFITMLRRLYTNVFEELEAIEDKVEDITANIFKSREREMVVEISEITRTLLEFKRVTDLHHEILESLKHRGQEMFGDGFANQMESVILDYLKINTTIKSNMEMLHELRDTDDSLLAAKQNETMKKLAVVGAILVILGILITLYR